AGFSRPGGPRARARRDRQHHDCRRARAQAARDGVRGMTRGPRRKRHLLSEAHVRIISRSTASIAVLCVLTTPAAAQDSRPASTPCQEQPCRISFDWGSGTSAASIPNDRRYGAATDFEAALKQTLTEQGLRPTEDERGATSGILLRMSTMSAIC